MAEYKVIIELENEDLLDEEEKMARFSTNLGRFLDECGDNMVVDYSIEDRK